MKKFVIAIWFLSAVPAFGQSVPPPCGQKGVPDNVPCYDAKSGKVIHTESPPFVPHQDIKPLPPPAEPLVVPKIQPAIVTPPDTGAPRIPQDWSYQGNDSCYHDGSTVQCLETSKLQGYVSSRERFEAQYQSGQVIGRAIGALVRVWMEHRRKIDLERKDIRQQISTYYNAALELNDEVMQEQDTLIVTYTRLARLDPGRRTIYEQGEKDSAKLISVLARMRPTLGTNLPGILAARDLKYLRGNLDVAKKIYNVTLDGGRKEYVYSQLMQALVGYYEFQQKTPK